MLPTRRRGKAIALAGGISIFCLIYFVISNQKPSTAQSIVTNCPNASSTAKKDSQDSLRSVPCLFEGTKRLTCLKDQKDVYLPFDKFLKKQFDISGRLVRRGLTDEHFEYFTSYSKVRVPEKLDYSATGEFGHFGSYNVEIRDRVRCVSAQHGVPMSTQWDNVPYFYPIQIAQYALQHYSRAVADTSPPREVIIETEFNDQGTLDVGLRPLRLTLHPEPEFTIIAFSWIPKDTSASFTITLRDKRLNKTITIGYKHVEDRRCVWSESDGLGDSYNDGPDLQDGNKKSEDTQELVFTYSLGSKTSEEAHVVRDMLVDATKVLALVQMLPPNRKDAQTPGGVKLGEIELSAITFTGSAVLKRSIVQKTKSNREFFLRAADWMVANQDADGGWPVPVARSIADNRLLLEAGWHSAMAQGHGLSVLTRAYHSTKGQGTGERAQGYLTAAKKALALFEKPPSERGVRNQIFGRDWYEEYPTQPGSFVLNGFLYALLGLYDFSTIEEVEAATNNSKLLFDRGMESLVDLLPLYDTGSGSIYDLRHVGLRTAPNLARWDYHTVHIYLLKWLHLITREKSLNEVADRWIGYAQGKKAKHN